MVMKAQDGAPMGHAYQVESPDEGELVEAASLYYGYQLLSRSSNVVTMQRFSGTKSLLDVNLSCKKLAYLENESTQKRSNMEFYEKN